MRIDQIAPEALKQPVRERALLAASLWESVGDPFELVAEQTDEDAVALAIERDRELDTGEVQPITHSELMERLRS